MNRLPKHVKNRAIFIFCFMFPLVMAVQYYGYETMIVTGLIGGIAGGLSVIIFPDPKYSDRMTADSKTDDRHPQADKPERQPVENDKKD